MGAGSTGGSETDDGVLSRRRVLTGAGLAVAATTAGTLVGTSVAGATSSLVAGATVIEFVSRISQSGGTFEGVGYLTAVAGFDSADLFTDPANRNESTARLVSFAEGELTSRSVEDVVHTLGVDGTLTVYRRPGGGASWSDHSTFSGGPVAAKFDLELQDVLTVIAPQTGLPTLTGTARQTAAPQFGGNVIGARGQLLRFTATGFGVRSDQGADVASAQAALTIAGSLFAV